MRSDRRPRGPYPDIGAYRPGVLSARIVLFVRARLFERLHNRGGSGALAGSVVSKGRRCTPPGRDAEDREPSPSGAKRRRAVGAADPRATRYKDMHRSHMIGNWCCKLPHELGALCRGPQRGPTLSGSVVWVRASVKEGPHRRNRADAARRNQRGLVRFPHPRSR